MKKCLFVLTAIFGIMFASLADDGALSLNGSFKGSKADAAAPSGWTKNYADKPWIGSSKMVQAEKDGIFTLQVDVLPAQGETPFYTTPLFPAFNDDTLEITVKVKGKGRIQTGIYTYGEKRAFLAEAKKTFDVDSPEQWLEIKNTVRVQDTDKGKVSQIRIMFAVLPRSNLGITDIKAKFAAQE